MQLQQHTQAGAHPLSLNRLPDERCKTSAPFNTRRGDSALCRLATLDDQSGQRCTLEEFDEAQPRSARYSPLLTSGLLLIGPMAILKSDDHECQF